MTTRARNHGLPPPGRVNPRNENNRRLVNNYQGQKIDQDHQLADTRYAPAESPTENEFSGDRISDDSYDPSADANDAEQHYREFSADVKPREKHAQDVPYTPYASGGKRAAPAYAAENYDELVRNVNAQRKTQDYVDKRGYDPSPNDPQAAITAQKFKRLKELQRRKDEEERILAQDMKRLQADPYFNNKPGVASFAGGRPQEKVYSQHGYYTGDRLRPSKPDNLEFCGTMTTVTSLTCGCVEQTTRPLFTTPGGRTHKRNCALDQQIHTKLSTPNAKLILGGNHASYYQQPGAKLKSKSFNEKSATATRFAGEKDYESRFVSSTRKPSETSFCSV